jgi:hypothetical protein
LYVELAAGAKESTVDDDDAARVENESWSEGLE